MFFFCCSVECALFGEKMPGLVIKKYRELRNYSQKYVASKMGMSQNAYSKIENNITQLTVHHVKELSKILDVPITDLLKDDFEIHRPYAVPKIVTKTDVLDRITILQKKVMEKHASKHDAYIAALSLIVAAEGSIALVH
jgi:transcriptional regulator with XRE-family HTH domain